MSNKRLYLFLAIVMGMIFCFSPAYMESSDRDDGRDLAAFSPYTHKSHLAYLAYFEGNIAYESNFTLVIENAVYDGGDVGPLFDQIAADTETLRTLFPDNFHSPSIIVVKKTIRGVQLVEDRVYCTPDDIFSGDYRDMLTAASLGFAEIWMNQGAAGWAFGAEADAAKLMQHYQAADDLDMLSLFAAYFLDAFASEEEQALAHETAVSLFAHGMNTLGITAFQEENRETLRQTWLASIGVSRAYADPYPYIFEGYTYNAYTNSKDYPLIVTTAKGDTMYVRQLNLADTPQSIMKNLSEAQESINMLFALFAEVVPERYDEIVQNYAEPIAYYSDPTANSYTKLQSRSIYINSYKFFLHESMHILFPKFYEADERWKYEALGEYVSDFLVQPYGRKRVLYEQLVESEYYQQLMEGVKEYDDTTYARERYLEAYGMPSNCEEVNVGEHCKLVCAYAYHNPNPGDNRWMMSIAMRYSTARKKYPASGGHELTMVQASCFMAHLVESYSLATVIDYCLDDVTFEEAFGVPYEVEKEKWTKEL